ncbi:1-acyl-sn-glycerol-3-phosphate acyltransferase [Gammaproteobacteria bacterium]|jgi:1-acyl-sn-glycerol-3-phosphate acyltransferase|nr:1-acyl-sn-glycerol-3-phosphate acyltransferase [Gammaproteobacteria bacterium]MDA8733271.1 1-acyl-sn-glycerol-3-phosphate acyltransferase [Gammaproteobacteria bacterium]MDA8815741.1 1-acyl-sn-glycerol-3-phosphate acyltransferase [Gammaproteobacteria bacterium]MDA9867673.1 1-acyl-sn-glycerol-3-phosphate acyltransferase [Gammaproteobacteria bacterium]MDC0961922.1 1-acyl-sn-glycerol-3-phosphate acyltransferase [Gammaproteobacteria bacterium]|tara:strand:- start:324 stop:947 length:624 start_codon:yes stop_codon:yes gene_type:complete
MSKKSNKTVSRTQIPFKYRASRPKIVQWLARWFLRVSGWKVEGTVPPVAGNENLVLIAGPHTSNWDGVFGFAAILGLDAKITFFGKYTLFNKPVLGRFLKYMGGIPVDKSKPGKGLTDVAIENMKKFNGSLIAMSPEGTRAKTEKMKSGFLRIAKAVEGQIFLGAFDFDKKRIVLDKFYSPSGNNEQDLQWVRNYFMQYKAKHPENY